jgi:hypothetical protein
MIRVKNIDFDIDSSGSIITGEEEEKKKYCFRARISAVYDPLPGQKCGQNSQKFANLHQTPSASDFERFSFFHSKMYSKIPFLHYFCLRPVSEGLGTTKPNLHLLFAQAQLFFPPTTECTHLIEQFLFLNIH